jgi:hypothetical protein
MLPPCIKLMNNSFLYFIGTIMLSMSLGYQLNSGALGFMCLAILTIVASFFKLFRV